jgi:spermidine/putrescine transport system substrate-binding protein
LFLPLLALLLTACPKKAEATLYFLNWADYIPEGLVKKFEKETGAKVVLDTFESPEAMLAKLKAGADREFSLVVAPDYYVLQMAREGLVAPLDKGRAEEPGQPGPLLPGPPLRPRPPALRPLPLGDHGPGLPGGPGAGACGLLRRPL